MIINLGENNMADDIKTLKITTVGENKYTYEKEPGFPFTIVEGEVYRRVPAERYEFQFPDMVNGVPTYGGINFGAVAVGERELFQSLFSLADADCIYDEKFFLSMYLYVDGSTMHEFTLDLEVVQGDYGRYVISETQVADEPVAFTLEPVYNYVLVD